MTKTKEQTVRVKVNPADRNGIYWDEVSVQSANWEPPEDESAPVEPYINRMVYAKPGIFKDGEFSESEVAKLEEKSSKILTEERERQEAEAKERVAAEQAKAATETKEAKTKTASKKSEG